MLDDNEKKELMERSKVLTKEVRDLRSKLTELNTLKEAAYHNKEKFSSQIKDQISTINESKSKRNMLSKAVREHKKARDELNQQIKDRITEAKELRQKKQEIEKKHNISQDPTGIKEKIQALVDKVETEVMSFTKEKECMKRIKDLKKMYEEARKVSDIWEKYSAINKEIKQLKALADEKHKRVQDSAAESQERHQEMITLSSDIDGIRKKQAELSQKYVEQKKAYTEANDQLKAKLLELNDISKKLNANRKEIGEVKKEKDEMSIAEKRKEVEDKIKTRKKLTTEDLLVMQRD